MVAQAQPSLTFDFLCEVLVRAGLLTPAQRKEATIAEPRERARLVRARATGPRVRGTSNNDHAVHPAEVLASLGLGQAGDARFPLNERLIMQALAKARRASRSSTSIP